VRTLSQASGFADAQGVIGDLVHGLVGRHRADTQQLQARAEACQTCEEKLKPPLQ